MQSKTLLTLAALSAAVLLPTSGALAQSDRDMNRAQFADTVMDAGQFRDALHRVRDLFSEIRENHTLALAAQDTLVASGYQDDNRRLLVDVLGVLDSITKNWKQTHIPAFAGETAELRSRTGASRWGTADTAKYATESPDTAFVRNTVWQLQNKLLADKLNGRDPIITDQMVEMLDAAITRAENPNFRVARAINWDRLNQKIEFAQREEVASLPSTSSESITRSETIETPSAAEETTIERTEVAEAPAPSAEESMSDTTTEERFGAANLPQTGGDPSLFYLLGSGLAGLGALIRRRTR